MNTLSILAFFSVIIYLYLGVHGFGLDRKSSLNKLFLCICVSFAVWSFCLILIYSADNKSECWFWYKISVVSTCMFGSLLLHFFIILFNKKDIQKKFLTYIFLYFPPIIFIVKSFYNNLDTKDFVKSSLGWIEVIEVNSAWTWIYFGYLIAYMIINITVVYIWSKEIKDIRQRKQARIIPVTAIIVFLTSILLDIILPSFNILAIPNMIPIIMLVWVFGILYTTIKFKLMNITSVIATEAILTKVKDLIILLDFKGTILKINNRVEEILGYNAKDLINKHFAVLFEDEELVKSTIESIKKSSSSNIENIEMMFKAVENILVPIRMSISVVRDKVGDVVGIVAIGQDMTLTYQLKKEIEERKIRESELIESNEKLKELDKMKTDFLSTISHELRTPLTSILGFSKIINKKFRSIILPQIDEPEVKQKKTLLHVIENIDIIIFEGEKLTCLINNILDIAKMEAEKVDWRMQKLSIKSVIENATKLMDNDIREANMKVIKDYGNEEFYVWGDFDRLVQVVVNLISNAIKFSSGNGCIIFSIVKRVRRVVVSVADTGIGILENDIKHIFDKFIQVGDTLTNRPQGTGLGLSICKQIIEYHKGKIWVESIINKGSKFSFALPLMEGDWLNYD